MTISSENRKSGPFLGTGSVSGYPFDFSVFSAADLLVVMADENGAESILSLGSDYIVGLNADQDADPGGTVTLTNPLPADYLLVITSDIEALQPTDLTNQGGFYPAVVNAALDRLTILIQQLAEQVDRAIKSPITSIVDPDDLIADLQQAASDAESAAVSASASAAAAATFDPALYLSKAGNLTGIASVSTARANLGLGSAATRTALGSTGSLYSRDSVLGTVSQSSGTPTGAVIETGNNANGYYTRYADGTQMCWTAIAKSVSAGGSTWTFPIAFSAAVTVTANEADPSQARFINIVAASLTTANVRCWTHAGVDSAGTYQAIAIGRWF